MWRKRAGHSEGKVVKNDRNSPMTTVHVQYISCIPRLKKFNQIEQIGSREIRLYFHAGDGFVCGFFIFLLILVNRLQLLHILRSTGV